MTGGISRSDACYIAVVMESGLITFYRLPDEMPLQFKLTMMVFVQIAVRLQQRHAGGNWMTDPENAANQPRQQARRTNYPTPRVRRPAMVI